jgi:hypothetical protein
MDRPVVTPNLWETMIMGTPVAWAVWAAAKDSRLVSGPTMAKTSGLEAA